MAQEGLELERQVVQILQSLQEAGELISYVQHPHNSEPDAHGKDFSASKMVGGEVVTVEFGVTISQQSKTAAEIKHHTVPQFCFPIGTKPETIRRRILGLFAS